MTPTAPAPTASPAPAADPFAIGWRDVKHTNPDGTTTWEQVPLTLEDALHPRDGETIVQNTHHDRDWAYLRDVVRSRVASDPHALVLSDCKVLWEDGVHHSPDLAVILGLPEVRDFYSQFEVAAEGVRPALIIEVVSPTTRVNDVETKVAHYHRYRVPLYVIIDRESDEGLPRLLGYERRPRQYHRMALEEDGRLWLEPLGVYLGIRDDRAVAFDGETDEELGDYTTISQALDQEQARAEEAERQVETERQRAETEKQRAEAAEARVRQLEAELRTRPAPPGP